MQQLIDAINDGDADEIAARIAALPSWVSSIVCSVVPVGADPQVDAWCGRAAPTPEPDDEDADDEGRSSSNAPDLTWLGYALVLAVAAKVVLS